MVGLKDLNPKGLEDATALRATMGSADAGWRQDTSLDDAPGNALCHVPGADEAQPKRVRHLRFLQEMNA